MESNSYQPEVTYIHDYKISDYGKLYTAGESGESAAPSAAPAENKMLAAEQVLKAGLVAFNRCQYIRSLENFKALLIFNPGDMNASFYAALSCFHLNRIDEAIQCLTAVLETRNSIFLPEAQWYLAQAYLKGEQHDMAVRVLQEIVRENGFYARKAADKLKSLGI